LDGKNWYITQGLSTVDPGAATDKKQEDPEPDSEQIKLCTVWGHRSKNTIYRETQARISKSEIWKIDEGNPKEACVHP